MDMLCVWLKEKSSSVQEVAAGSMGQDDGSNRTMALFGLVPVKTVRAISSERREVTVCGTPFGIKMFSNGALVVAFSDLYTSLGSENPAKEAGLRLPSPIGATVSILGGLLVCGGM